MEQYDLLRKVVKVLEHLGIPYFVTGSIASMYYGEPRFTNDIDIVADIRSEQIESFFSSFPEEEFYLSKEAMDEAIGRKSMFNIIHPSSGLKADIAIPTGDSFDASRFARRQQVDLSGDLRPCFASPEDVILKKMAYFQEGGSEKHLRDITGMLVISGGQIDEGYIQDWASQLGLLDIWKAIQARLRKQDRMGGESGCS